MADLISNHHSINIPSGVGSCTNNGYQNYSFCSLSENHNYIAFNSHRYSTSPRNLQTKLSLSSPLNFHDNANPKPLLKRLKPLNSVHNERQYQCQSSSKSFTLKPSLVKRTKSFDYAEMCQNLPLLENDKKRRKVTFAENYDSSFSSKIVPSSLSSPDRYCYLPTYKLKSQYSSKILHLECEIKQVKIDTLKQFKELQEILEKQTQQIEELRKQNNDLKKYLEQKNSQV